MKQLVCIAHDIRSTHNVGSLLRTCEGLGVDMLYLTGYTPFPIKAGDPRLPHESAKLHKQISKTALGAESSMPWKQQEDIESLIHSLRASGFQIIALEQSSDSIPLPDFKAPDKVALLLGREVEGIDEALLGLTDYTVEIPMFGKKESFNVVQAAAMSLYHCRFMA